MLDDLLAAVRAAGRLDSPGFFTLAREPLLQKLNARPFAALPWLISAALKSGASRLSITRGSRELVLEHDGQPPCDLGEATTDELSLGLLVAARLGVDFSGGDLRLRARGTSWEQRAGPRVRAQKIRLNCPDHEGLDYWLERLRLAPVAVEVDGRAWNRRGLSGDFLVTRHSESAHLGLGRQVFTAVSPSQPSLTLVVGGISVGRELRLPQAQAIVWSDGLQRTLEGDDLVEDQAYQALRADLFRQFRDMAAELAARVSAPGRPPGLAARVEQVLQAFRDEASDDL